MVSPTDIWAIGLPASIYHWDGTAWSQVSTPPPPFGPDVLYGLAAAASNDVWAVGSQGGGESSRILASFTGDGTAWTYVCCTSSAAGAAPAGGIGTLDDLFDVAALGNGTARVVGERMTDINPVATLFGNCTIAGCSIYPSASGVYNAISEDGVWIGGGTPNSQTLIAGPNTSAPDVGDIRDIAVVAPNSVWATGRTGIIRWDGTAWAVVPAPAPTTGTGWQAIDGVAANDVWAANGDGTLWHWDGSGWTAANLPGLTVRGIDMTGPVGWAGHHRLGQHADHPAL